MRTSDENGCGPDADVYLLMLIEMSKLHWSEAKERLQIFLLSSPSRRSTTAPIFQKCAVPTPHAPPVITALS